jgi:hypothetical protein
LDVVPVGLTILTESIPLVKLGDFFSQEFEAIGGEPPLSWSIAAGTLPSEADLSPNGILSGTPPEAGEFTFTVRVTDSNGDSAEKEFILKILVTLPPPEIRVHKAGTTSVPGRTIDYFIVIENVGSVEVDDVHALEFLLPPSFFHFVTANPSPDAVTEPFLYWALPPLKPGKAEIISYSVRLDGAVELGWGVPGSVLVGICKFLGCDAGIGKALADKLRDAMRKNDRPCLDMEAWNRAIDSCGEFVQECLPIPTVMSGVWWKKENKAEKNSVIKTLAGQNNFPNSYGADLCLPYTMQARASA